MNKITLGCDPELFLFHKGRPISAHDIVPGTKNKPYKLSKGAVQVDGLALEFNIDPAATRGQFSDNILTTLSEIRAMVPSELEFGFIPAVFFEPGYFDRVPETAKELGCNPDFCAYTSSMNPPPDVQAWPYLRTGSGHIHVGWTEGRDKQDPEHFLNCCAVIRGLDKAYLGVKNAWDKDETRANLYGRPGAFRPATFGVEHRVPSNAWVQYPKLYPFLFDLYEAAMIDMIEGKRLTPAFKEEYLSEIWS